MKHINIKPLSTNRLFQGRRFRTRAYDVYKVDVLYLLGAWMPTIYPKMTLHMRVGLSSKNADLDNTLKAFQDILQAKYKFNDSHIYRINAEKTDVAKGSEFIEVELLPFAPLQP